MRIATRVYSLNNQSQDEVVYTYQRVFKYLLEQLKPEAFSQLTY
jgi:hypothetical protein